MKSTFLTLAVSATNVAAVKFISGPEGWPQALGFNTTDAEAFGDLYAIPAKVKRDAAALPTRVELKNRNPHIPGAKSVKLRYGPYTVPGARTYVQAEC